MNLSSKCQRVLWATIGSAVGLSMLVNAHAQPPASSRHSATGPMILAAASTKASARRESQASPAQAETNIPAPSFSAIPLSDSVVQIAGGPANIVVLDQPEGLLLVNGGPKAHAPALQTFLATTFPGKAVKVIFNTDWHPENTGFNETAAAAGAKIVAHENTRQWLGTTIHCKWREQTFSPSAPAALPTETFYTTDQLTFGREKVVYGYLGQAHTDGDIYVYFPGPNVLVAGDVMTVGSYPILDYTTGGWIGGLANATRTLLDVAKDDTRIVPGSGPVQSRADLAAENNMLSAMREKLVKMMKSGMGVDEIITAAPTREFDARWGNPERFMKNVYPGLWWHAREVGGVI